MKKRNIGKLGESVKKRHRVRDAIVGKKSRQKKNILLRRII